MKQKIGITILVASFFIYMTTSCQSEDTGDEPVIPVSGITLNSQALNLTVGETATIIATVSPVNASNSNVLWTSSNASVASVDNGTISAKSEGNVTVTAISDDGGKTANCVISVTSVSVESVSLDHMAVKLGKGQSIALNASVNPSNAINKSVSWESGDPTVATVNQDGIVTAVNIGVATITVKTDDGGKTGSCIVTVIDTTNSGGNEDIYYDDWN